jgi:hypothetical protein
MGAPFETEEGGNLATPHRMSNFACVCGELERLGKQNCRAYMRRKKQEHTSECLAISW